MTIRTKTAKPRARATRLVPGDEALLRQEIAVRAYYRSCDRGGLPGFEDQDWLAAERDVLAERSELLADRLGTSKSVGRTGSKTTKKKRGS